MNVLLALVLSWVGFATHNFADLPGQTLLSPETLYPTVLYLLLALAWFFKPGRLSAGLLLFWAGLNFLGGGIISVLPLPFLPFDPAQTAYHYAFHGLYALTQVPAMVVLIRYLRSTQHKNTVAQE